MSERSLDDYNLALPPVSEQDMQKAAAEIQIWHSNGARLWETPLDALITTLNQTIATAKRLLDDLTKPSSQSMPGANKQTFLNNFRTILDMHARSQLDIAGLKAKAVSVKWEFEEMEEETEEEAAKWEKLSNMLTDKEEVTKKVGKKVEDLEDELEKEQWSDALQVQEKNGGTE